MIEPRLPSGCALIVITDIYVNMNLTEMLNPGLHDNVTDSCSISKAQVPF
jgi:hypothetical protein